jgi:hypothetical protein
MNAGPLKLATPSQVSSYAERLRAFAARCGRRTDIADHLLRCAQIAAGEEESFYDQTPAHRRFA